MDAFNQTNSNQELYRYRCDSLSCCNKYVKMWGNKLVTAFGNNRKFVDMKVMSDVVGWQDYFQLLSLSLLPFSFNLSISKSLEQNSIPQHSGYERQLVTKQICCNISGFLLLPPGYGKRQVKKPLHASQFTKKGKTCR